MSVKASCSRCKFSRRFSAELGGRYYRCPKCKQGVIAVPKGEASESEEVPLRLSSSSFENPFLAVAKRTPKGHQETMEMTDVGSTAEGTHLTEKAEEPEPVRKKPKKPVLDATLPDGLSGAEVIDKDSREADVPKLADDDPTDHRGQIATARRILVECGLCGFLVRIPAEFFGKTVHCPECAGNTIFSESTLDPVKDELLDRLMMETRERQLLFPPAGERDLLGDMKRLMGNNAFRSFLVGVALGVLVLVGAWVVVKVRRSQARTEVVKKAVAGGWRYATAISGSKHVFHEPWCRELEAGVGRRVTEAAFRAEGAAAELHACQ